MIEQRTDLLQHIFSAIANNLTPKLTESDIVEISSGHYRACVQRTILSAGVRTIRDALNLLNKFESLEVDGRRKSNSGSTVHNRANPSDSNTKPSQDRSFSARLGFQNMRNVRYHSTRNYDRNRQYSQTNSRHEKGSLTSGRVRQDVQDGAMPAPSNHSRRNLNPDANSLIIQVNRYINFTNLFWHENLRISDSSSVHHQEFIHCTLSNGMCHTGL
jgi:hypothetical protein